MNNREKEALNLLDEKVSRLRNAFSLLPKEGQERVIRGLYARARRAEKLSATFSKLEENPCITCADTCCYGLGHLGYHKKNGTDIHPDVILGKVDLKDFVVPHIPEDFPSFSVLRAHKCLFLSNKGCNLPPKYRSNTCLGHTCSILDRVLTYESLMKGVEKGISEMEKMPKRKDLLKRASDILKAREELEKTKEKIASLEHEADVLLSDLKKSARSKREYYMEKTTF